MAVRRALCLPLFGLSLRAEEATLGMHQQGCLRALVELKGKMKRLETTPTHWIATMITLPQSQNESLFSRRSFESFCWNKSYMATTTQRRPMSSDVEPPPSRPNLYMTKPKKMKEREIGYTIEQKEVEKGDDKSEKNKGAEQRDLGDQGDLGKRDYKLLFVQGVVLMVVTWAMANVIGNSVVTNAVHLCRAKGAFFKKTGASRLGYIAMVYPKWVEECGGLEALYELLILGYDQEEDINMEEEEKLLSVKQQALDSLLILLQDPDVRTKARKGPHSFKDTISTLCQDGKPNIDQKKGLTAKHEKLQTTAQHVMRCLT